MKDASVKNALRSLLAAWMLLATSVTSSTVVHGHRGGNLSHRHDRADCTLSRSFAPTAIHDGHDGDMSLSALDVHRHWSLAPLGAVTHPPTPSEPTGPHGESLSGWETIVAISAVQSVRTLSKGVAFDHCRLDAIALSLGCVSLAKHREILLSDLAVAPLCDRARTSARVFNSPDSQFTVVSVAFRPRGLSTCAGTVGVLLRFDEGSPLANCPITESWR